MATDQTEKTLTPDEILLETVESLLAQPEEPIGNFKSRYALMLACTKIVWGPEQKYAAGVVMLNPEKFTVAPLALRKRMLDGLLTDMLSDLYMTMRDKDKRH
jgi:hypothetical protein